MRKQTLTTSFGKPAENEVGYGIQNKESDRTKGQTYHPLHSRLLGHEETEIARNAVGAEHDDDLQRQHQRQDERHLVDQHQRDAGRQA